MTLKGELRVDEMDPNVVAAIISVAGSMTLASMGALAKWYNKRAYKKNVKGVLGNLYQHPVLFLYEDEALRVQCHDVVKAELLDSIRKSVICTPIRDELLELLSRLQTNIHTINHSIVSEGVMVTREQIFRTQERATLQYPASTHVVIKKLVHQHADSLAIASDLLTCSYSVEHILELVFDIFYVSTFTVLSQWMQTANQLNGHLNGVVWNSQHIGHSFNGNVTDVMRILNSTIPLIYEALGVTDCCVFVVDEHSCILGSCGSMQCLQYAASDLSGMKMGTLQIGLHNLQPEQDLRTLSLIDRDAYAGCNVCRIVPIMDSSKIECTSVTFVAPVGISLPSSHQIFLVMMVKSSHPYLSRVGEHGQSVCSSDCSAVDDAHTRLAFILSTLTHPVRRIVLGCSMDTPSLPFVEATMDGSPDLPHFQSRRFLHTQMGIPPRRMNDVCARCESRLHGDLLRSSTFTYLWSSKHICAEFYLIGDEKRAILSIHRPISSEANEATVGGPATDSSVLARNTNVPKTGANNKHSRTFGNLLRSNQSR